jgi:hypothetical protein
LAPGEEEVLVKYWDLVRKRIWSRRIPDTEEYLVKSTWRPRIPVKEEVLVIKSTS